MELKKIVGYLPYGVQCMDYTLEIPELFELDAENLKGVLSDLHYSKETIKMALHPLSDLTKPIEHKGKTFIPALALWPISAKEEEDFEVYGIIPDYWKACIKYLTELRIDYRDIQKLYEWHFAIGLEESEFIDVNDLDVNPYK